MPTFEIYRRSAKQHRAGHFAVMIDGIEAEYTNDPGQFMPKALREALAAGASPGPDATEAAAAICEEYSRKALQRTIDHIQAGQLFPGGVPLGVGKMFVPPAYVAKSQRHTSRDQAVIAFLNRGHLLGLTDDQRAARNKNRDTQTDHAAAWRESRKALIAAREKEREEIERELAGNVSGKPRAILEKRLAQLELEIPALHGGVHCASHGFQYANGQFLTKQVDLVNDDIRLVKCMTNTTVDTERDAKDMVSDFTTLDEFDGSGYSSGGQALDSQAVNIDDANDRAEFDAADEAATLGAGTRAVQGNLLISFLTTLNGSLPIFWIEYAANKTMDGSLFTDVFNAEGILQMADG